jgi:hypothetical protein
MEFMKLGKYAVKVSLCGCVVSTITGKQLKATPDKKNGYPRVYAKNYDGKRYGLYVHRLVAIAWIAKPEGKNCINHKDGDKGNFAFENLEWCTHAENMRHSKNTGLWGKMMGKEHFKERDKIIQNLYNFGVGREIICAAFEMNRPALNRVIRKMQGD